MKTSVLSVLALSFGLLAQGGTSLAAEQQPFKAVPKIDASPNVPTGISLPDNQKLYKPAPSMKISKSSPPRVLTAPSVSRSGAIPTFDPINSAFDALKRAGTELNEARVAFGHKAQECWDKDYTQADQAAAGCSYTETVASCYEKLAIFCVTPANVRWHNAEPAFTRASDTLKYTILEYNRKLAP